MIQSLIFSFAPIVAVFAMVTMLVLRAGASRVFFDVVGSFQANRLIGDAQAKITVLQSLVLDGLSGITESIQLISDQMDSLVDSTVPLSQEIATARLEFEKFANFTDVDMATEAIIELGETYAFSGDQALVAGAKMAQLSDIVGGGKATVAATEIGMQFGMIGGMETEDAMKKMISLQQQTGFMYGDLEKANFDRMTSEQKANVVRANSIRMLNQLNTIENRSAATMSQITHVMNQFASSGKLAGDSTAYMAAMSATLIEAGEEQGKAGRALKMMYARLGANTGNNAEVLKRYGIEVKGANGELRSMEDILNDVAMRYGNLKDADKLALAQAMAGNDHYVRAIKLFENHRRVVKLDTQAVGELDTAQEELNKKMADVSFQLKEQEARLVNAKAAVGAVFTPAVLRATKAQADLNFAFAEFAEENEIYRGVIEGMFTAQQLGKLYAPIVEAQLNMMSLNVSMRTQQQIARAMNNEQLVRSSAYGGQVAMQRISMDMLDAELSKMSQLTQISIGKISMENQEMMMRSANAQMSRALTTEELKQAQTSKQDLQTKIITLQTEQTRVQTANALTDAERRIVAQRTQTARIATIEKLDQLDKIQLMSIEEMAQKRIDDGHFKRITQVDQVMSNSAAKKKTEQMLEIENARVLEDIEMNRGILMQRLGFYTQENQAAKTGEVFLGEQQIQQMQQQSQLMSKLISDEGKRVLLANAMETEIKGQTQGEIILAAASTRLNEITKMKSNTEQQNKAIVDAMVISAQQLAAAYNLNEQEIMQILPKMKLFAQTFAQVKTQQDLTVQSSMRQQAMLMKTSGILSAVSMGFSMFSDSERSARASMILMNLAMIPSMIQMFALTKQTHGLMIGANAAAGGVNNLTFSLKGLKTAIMMTGLGALVIGGTALLAWLFAGKDKTDDMADAMMDFGQAINYTKEEYEDMMDTYLDYDLKGLSDATNRMEYGIEDLQRKIAEASDETVKKAYQSRLDILMKEHAILKDIENLTAAETLTTDQAALKEVFGLVKDYQQAGQDLAQAEDNFGFFDNLFSKYTWATSMGDEDLMYSGAQKEIFGLEDAYADAFAAIPEEFQGAIMDLAKEAETAEDFMADLTDFIETDMSALSLGGFADGIQESIIGPIEAAKEAAFEFSNAREEMFFGMAKGNITGDMVKQVVNKGVETLINTTEVIMTNNFNGMTTGQAANEITKQVIQQLNSRGLNIAQ